MTIPMLRGRCARRWSHSTLGRIAAAMMKPRKSSAITTRICHRASAATTMATTTVVATAARRATPISRVFSPCVEARKPMLATAEEHVFLDARRHGIVLVRPFLRAVVIAAAGWAAFLGGWPFSIAGAPLLIAAAVVATAAVWKWDRTHVVLTTEKLFIVHGVVRRHAAAVRLAKVHTVEIEQSLLGRIFGYGTIVAGDLEIR